MLTARTRAELDAALATLRNAGGAPTLVPTMGALHDGHLSLIAAARKIGRPVVASIFVNPLQFGQAEDLSRYPRDEAGDLEKLRGAGCDAVWLPGVAEMYPAADATFVDVGGPANGWEGDARPGHFRGVATVVAKLFGQCKPEAACFGEKDWQQLQVITRFTTDLALGVRIIGVPTMRESDGLALSSRNRFLTPDERATAPILHRALQDAAAHLRRGDDAQTALSASRAVLQTAGLGVDYLALVDGPALRPIENLQSGARLIAAARLGTVRLLDNIDPL
jgi:pantoate--beta-alanine ligase